MTNPLRELVRRLRRGPGAGAGGPGAGTSSSGRPPVAVAPSDQVPSRRWLHDAVAGGEAVEALERVTTLAVAGRSGPLLLLDAHDVAVEMREDEAAHVLRTEIARRLPRAQDVLNRAVAAIRRDDDDLTPPLLAVLAESGTDLDLWPLEQLRDTWEARRRLRATEASTPAAEQRRSAGLEQTPTSPRRLAVLVAAASRENRWELVADWAGTFPGTVTARETGALRMTLSRAQSDGALSAVAAVGALLQRSGAAREADSLAVVAAREEVQLLASGWPRREAVEPGASTSSVEQGQGRSTLYLLGQSLPHRSGGYATRSHGIATSIRELGWDLHAATRLGFPYDLWQGEGDSAVNDLDVVAGVPYHRLQVEGRGRVPTSPVMPYVELGADRGRDLARRLGSRLVHSASLWDVGRMGLEVAQSEGLPFVYELRGLKQLLEEARNPRFADSERARFLDAAELAVARDADHVLAITTALADELSRMGVPRERISVLPNGVDPARFAPRPRDEDLARRLGLQGTTVIGYVGSLVHYEGLEDLVDAFAQVRSARPDTHLLIVGDGAHERRLHRRAELVGLGDAVTFTGRVAHDLVPSYLSLVDVAPFPRSPLRVCELISPIKPFEAMAGGIPVVVSSVAALTEIVQDDVTGRVFRKGDKAHLAEVLVELVDDVASRQRLASAARAWVQEQRSWTAISRTVDEVYRRLLA